MNETWRVFTAQQVEGEGRWVIVSQKWTSDEGATDDIRVVAHITSDASQAELVARNMQQAYDNVRRIPI